MATSQTPTKSTWFALPFYVYFFYHYSREISFHSGSGNTSIGSRSITSRMSS